MKIILQSKGWFMATYDSRFMVHGSRLKVNGYGSRYEMAKQI